MISACVLSMCAYISVYIHVSEGAWEGQKEQVDPVEKLQAAVGCLTWVLGTKLWSSAKT